MEFRTYPSKHGKSYLVILKSHLYSGPIFLRFLSLISLFQTLEFLPYFCNHWNSYLILKLETLEFWRYLYAHWNSYFILSNVGILALFLQTMEISSYPSKNWSSGPILMRIGFLICPFETLGFWLYFYKHWNYDLMPANIGILALFYKHWKSDLILIYWSSGSIGRLTSSFQRLEFSMIVIPALFFQTLEFLSHYSTANIEILAPSFETVWIVFFF